MNAEAGKDACNATMPADERLPTLTEVVALAATPMFAEPVASAEPVATVATVATVAPASQPPAIDEEALIDAVMAGLQQHVDRMFEYRLRETLAPILARVAQTIVDETRVALAATLRDVVARAAAQEASKRKARKPSTAG